MARLRALRPRVATLDTRSARPAAKTANAFYASPSWRTLIAALIKLRGRRCQRCGREGCRIFGDHIIELSDGGAPLDGANVELLCGSCHTTKTAQARAARRDAPINT